MATDEQKKWYAKGMAKGMRRAKEHYLTSLMSWTKNLFSDQMDSEIQIWENIAEKDKPTTS